MALRTAIICDTLIRCGQNPYRHHIEQAKSEIDEVLFGRSTNPLEVRKAARILRVIEHYERRQVNYPISKR